MHLFASAEFILKVLHCVALVNHNKCDTIVWRRVFILQHEFYIQEVFRSGLPKTSLYFATTISCSTSSFVDKTMEGILFCPSYLLSHDALSGEKLRLKTFTPVAFLLLKLIYQTFLKAGRLNCDVFRQK